MSTGFSTERTLISVSAVPHCGNTKDSNPILLHDTRPHNDAPPYDLWLQKVDQFRRYLLDKAGQMNRQTDGKCDFSILYFVTGAINEKLKENL